ncbi:MAG: hypothetical protein UW70_C0026G0005 [Candidatus Peregrinibacteria bacterium GW2011_GWA2_44_7]|nr:MAG: hypothetical protein UW70_C0026G0005 [Candidatus Peregrinibacteria bacterium GW2011_GWA2_44_7]
MGPLFIRSGMRFMGINLGILILGVSMAAATNLSSTEFSADIQPINDNPEWSQTDLACSTGYMQHDYKLMSVNDSGHDYWSTIHSTAMVLDTDYDSSYMPDAGTPSTNDFLTNIKTESMYCTLGDDTYHFCGFDKEDDLGKVIASGDEWGGTTITYEKANFLPGSPRALVWRYSADDFGNTDNTPWLHARSSTSQTPPKLVETIWMEPIDYTTYRTATAEAYFLVEHWYQDAQDKWIHTYTVDSDSDRDGKTSDEPFNIDSDADYAYWFGTSGTRLTFNDCVEEAPYCEVLDITAPTSISAADANAIQTVTIDVDDQKGGAWDGKYEYSGKNPDGTTSTCRFSSSYRTVQNGGGSNPYTSTAETVYVGKCGAGDTIAVKEVDYPNVCKDSLTIGNACESLTITSPTVIEPEDLAGIVTVNINVKAASGDTWDGQYTFTAYSKSGAVAKGKFTNSYTYALLGSGSNPYTTNSETVYYTGGEPGDRIVVTETTYGVCTDSITSEEAPTPYCGNGELDEGEVCDYASQPGEPGYNEMCTQSCTLYTCEQARAEGKLWGYFDTARTEVKIFNDTTYPFDISLASYEFDEVLANQVFYDSYTDEVLGGTAETWTLAEVISFPGYPVCQYQVDLFCGPVITQGAPDYGTRLIDSYVSEPLPACLGAPYCGDGMVDTDGPDNVPGNTDDEVCDDGNTTNGDGCSSTCQPEPTPTPYCGDGVLDTNGVDNIPSNTDDEVCDDGNITNGDGCSSTCKTEPTSSACISLAITPEVTTSFSQVVFTITPNPSNWPGPWTWTTSNLNGIFNADNGSKVGNTITSTDLSVEYNGGNGDLITVYEAGEYSNICQTTAYISSTGTTTPPSSGGGGNPGGGGGSSNYCGDGIIQNPNDLGTHEECDDGNSVNNDGCSNVCQIEEIEEVCTSLVVKQPEGTIIDDLPETLEVQALDSKGRNWTDPDGLTYEWSTTGTGSFEDTDDIERYLETNETIVTYDGPDSERQVTLTVEAGESSTCRETFTIQLPQPTTAPADTLTKSVDTYNFGFYRIGSSVITANGFDETEPYGHDYDYAFYELTYTPDPYLSIDEVKLTDTISNPIPGKMADGTATGEISYYIADDSDVTQVRCWVDGTPDGNGNDCGNNGSYRGFSVKYENGTEIPVCEEGNTAPCYTGDINATDGITLKHMDQVAQANHKVVIHYLGQVDNGNFNCTEEVEDCPVLGFHNSTEVDGGRLEASADVSVICPYMLTRNAGDVYFEEDPTAGFDLTCYYPDYRNSDGLVFSRMFSRAQNQVCNGGDNNTLIGRFSSYVCEMLVDVQQNIQWNSTTIQTQQNKNTTSISRYNDNLSSLKTTSTSNPEWGTYYKITNFENLRNTPGIQRSNQSQNVYKISNANLVLDLGNNTIPEGGYTFIIENGTLFVESDIEYQSVNMSTVSNLKKIPSIAFIVLGGEVYIDSSVEKMAGVYYVTKREDGSGGILNGDWTDPFTPLEIFGSVYGDMTPLTKQRTFSGPANYDHGNVVVRYDERILLNPPPGLEQYVNIQSERVAE